MEKKTILFDGGPLHNTFREVYINDDRVALDYQKEDKTYARAYYKATSTKYNNIQVFVWIDIDAVYRENENEALWKSDVKPKENESDNKDIEAGEV